MLGAGRPAPGPSGGIRFWTYSHNVPFFGGGAEVGRKFGFGRTTRQRITALLGRVGSRVRLFSMFFSTSKYLIA